jgi:hypothetical protein
VLSLFAAEVIAAALPKLRNLDPITKKGSHASCYFKLRSTSLSTDRLVFC